MDILSHIMNINIISPTNEIIDPIEDIIFHEIYIKYIFMSRFMIHMLILEGYSSRRCFFLFLVSEIELRLQNFL